MIFFQETVIKFLVKDVRVENRRHLRAVFARMARRVLIDWARARTAANRDGMGMPLDEALAVTCDPADPELIITLDTMIMRLDDRERSAIELMFFRGLTVEEVAKALRTS